MAVLAGVGLSLVLRLFRILCFPFTPLFRYLLKRIQAAHEVGTVEGIRVSDESGSGGEFLATIRGALHLLKETSPRHFAHIKRRLKWVHNLTLPVSAASYRHWSRTCIIDFNRCSHPEFAHWDICWCAQVLVHEATHGRIAMRGIHYTRRRRERIERIAVAEENRFLRHMAFVHPEWAKQLHREYDASKWARSWNPTWRDAIRGLREHIRTQKRARAGK
jgi:hypothetical protein